MRCPHCDKSSLNFSGQRKYFVDLPQKADPRLPERVLISIVEYMECPICDTEVGAKSTYVYKLEGAKE